MKDTFIILFFKKIKISYIRIHTLYEVFFSNPVGSLSFYFINKSRYVSVDNKSRSIRGCPANRN